MTQRTQLPAVVIGALFAIVLTFIDIRFLTGELASNPVVTFIVNAVFLFTALSLYGFLMQKAAAAGMVGPAAERKGTARRTGSDAGSERRDSGKRNKSSSRNRKRGGKGGDAASAPAEDADPREQGNIKWFSGTKGFGFIIRQDGSEVFVHHRAIRGQGRRDLPDGQAVSFVVVERDKGLQADQVELEGSSGSGDDA